MTTQTDSSKRDKMSGSSGSLTVLVLFGTRPEAIKLAPVIGELARYPDMRTITVSSSQHTDLLEPFLQLFGLRVDHDLRVMTPNQTPNEVGARVLAALDAVLRDQKPDFVLVQGDTTTAFAGALAAFNRKTRIGHVEAGLRSGDLRSPFPEEMNRRLISQIADLNFAATPENRKNLLREQVASDKIFVVGNTVVDALHFILENSAPGDKIKELIKRVGDRKLLLLTTHRRESFGRAMSANLEVLERFVAEHPDVCLAFPVHPNPNVRRITGRILAGRERVYLLEPLDYADFIALMKRAWLIISDSGGVQEEAPSLGKPLLVLRENTERPEGLRSGVAKLVGGEAEALAEMLKTNYNDDTWIRSVKEIDNPFGDGASARRIVRLLRTAAAGWEETPETERIADHK